MLYAAYDIFINYLMRIWYMPHMWYEFKSNVKVGLNILLNKMSFMVTKCVWIFSPSSFILWRKRNLFVNEAIWINNIMKSIMLA